MPRFKDLGHWAHYQAHLVLNLGDDERYELPNLHSTSLISVGRWQHRERIYPRPELVRAINKRAGQAEENEVVRERQRIRAAVLVLRDYDEVLYRVVDTVCLRGGAKLLTGARTRHEGPEFEKTVSDYFEGDYQADAILFERHGTSGWQFPRRCDCHCPAATMESQ